MKLACLLEVCQRTFRQESCTHPAVVYRILIGRGAHQASTIIPQCHCAIAVIAPDRVRGDKGEKVVHYLATSSPREFKCRQLLIFEKFVSRVGVETE